MSARVELAHESDVRLVGELLHRFNTEFGEPTPGAERLAERVRELLADRMTDDGAAWTDVKICLKARRSQR